MVSDIEYYLNTFKVICSDIIDEELEFMKPDVSFFTILRKDFLLKPSVIQTEMYFLSKGLVRCFYIDNFDNEITVSFLAEGQYVTDYMAFINQQKTKYYFQCIEDCTIVRLPYATIQKVYNKYKSMEKYGRLIAELILETRTRRMESFLFESAEERYLNFQIQNPNLLGRVSVTHLASYLGIKRQSLTRIRKRIARL